MVLMRRHTWVGVPDRCIAMKKGFENAASRMVGRVMFMEVRLVHPLLLYHQHHGGERVV